MCIIDRIYSTVNLNAKGQISEIYFTTDREGTLIMGLLNSLSKTISVMLQYQIPAQNISKLLRGQKYEPYGFVTRHPYIKYCTSISDLISKIIDIEIGDFSRCQVKPESGGLPDTLDTAPAFPDLPDREYATGVQGEPGTGQPSLPASVQGERLYDGSTCPTCSSTRMVRNGTCKVCLDCGTTTGCS